jgi:DNA helicase-2/ATP-dependent DNA helicase PcrA
VRHVEILADLNPEQRRAVQTVRGPVCILAGAGTGKTTTITRRIANQVATGTFAPPAILAVTFTDKAAGEMRSRLAALGVDGVDARTFHSAALSQLGRFGASPHQVLSSKVVALRQIANSLPRPYRFRPAADLATEIEWAKNRRIPAEGYANVLGTHEPPIPADLMERVYRQYEQGKQRRELVDFEDLLELTIRLFDDDASVGERFRARTRAITVDEYQDANLLQQTLLERWLGDRDDLCAVGDDYQSIYGFTGATPAYLLDMPSRFPGCAVVRLEENHRSTPEILEVANRLVPRLGGVGKVLRATRADGAHPEVRGFADADAEAAFLVSAVRTLHRDGIPFERIAVLSRVNSRSEDFEEALAHARIPFQVRGGAFLTRPAARAVLRRLREGSSLGVASQVAAIASAEGHAPGGDIPEDLGEQETVRQNDLARLVRLAEEFDANAVAEGGAPDAARAAGATVQGFVEDLRRRFASDGEGRGVNLLTFHRAKGLEFDAVFLPRLQEGELPFRRSKTDEAIQEERRLLYVGITRSRRYLAITWVADGRSRPSRFVSEIRPDAAATPPGAVRPHHDRSGGAGPRIPIEVAPGAEPSFQALRAWRLERSRADGVPPYVVFHDRTLAEIAGRRPRSRAQLLSIDGIGPAKLERYADEVLAVLGTLAAPDGSGSAGTA